MKWFTSIFYVVVLSIMVIGCAMKSVNNNNLFENSLAHKQQPKISAQLWSVKEDVKNDIEAALRQIAAMGFEGVELAGEFGSYADNPQGLKQLLDSLGLKVSGAHVGFEQFSAENFEKTLAFYRTLKCRLLIIPWDERSFDSQGVQVFVSDLLDLQIKLAPEGFRLGFHNHHQELASYQEATYWDYIAEQTPPDFILQQDVGWTTYAGKDPVEYVRRYPGRTLTTHFKATLPEGTQGKLPIIGRDTIDWPSLIKANIDVGGTRWFVVEQEDYPEGMTPMEALRASKEGLDEVLGQLF